MSFSIKGDDFNITFKDSMQFMDKLVTTKKDSKYTFTYMDKIFGENAEMLTRKCVMFYDYYDSPLKDKEIKLPPREDFKSKLTGESISEAEYLWAELVWEKMKCRNIRDYVKLYLHTDVMLLVDVFESLYVLK